MPPIEPGILDTWKRLGPRILSNPAELQREPAVLRTRR